MVVLSAWNAFLLCARSSVAGMLMGKRLYETCTKRSQEEATRTKIRLVGEINWCPVANTG
jgi:hypothetical protein